MRLEMYHYLNPIVQKYKQLSFSFNNVTMLYEHSLWFKIKKKNLILTDNLQITSSSKLKILFISSFHDKSSELEPHHVLTVHSYTGTHPKITQPNRGK